MRSRRNAVIACLAGVAAALLIVGVVSGTFIRHVVQIVPVAVALVAVRERPAWGSHAALPIFAWWLSMMVLVWLYLAGVPMFFDGTFTLTEIVLTGLVALFCMHPVAQVSQHLCRAALADPHIDCSAVQPHF